MIPQVFKVFQALQQFMLIFGQFGYIMDWGKDIYDDEFRDDMSPGYNNIVHFVYNNWWAQLQFIAVQLCVVYLLIYGNYIRFH